jgi:hypothetical protein
MQSVRKGMARQIPQVAAAGLHGLGLGGIACPQLNTVPRWMASGTDGQCRAPGPCAKKNNFHSWKCLSIKRRKP